MNKLNIKVLALAVGLAFSAGAMAQSMSKQEYKAGRDRIAADYKSGKVGCASLSGNANDICVAEVKGREKVATAELEDSYEPSRKTHYEVRVTKAEADYAVAKDRCDDKAGNVKDVCVKEARAAETTAKADAMAQMKTANANDTASEKSAEARSDANNKVADARRDAAAETLDAQYGVAKEKCDTYAGGAKDYCLNQAKARFGKL